MNITVIGTGLVGRNLAERLSKLGHNITIGTRNPDHTLARVPGDYAQWQAQHPQVQLLSYAEAARDSDVVINASAGIHALDALRAVGSNHLVGKTLIDLALPLDLSRGLPPRLVTANDDSLGEQIQREFPDAHVVKTLNSVYTEVMIDPARVPGQHNLFLSGDHADAKTVALTLLEQMGWPTDSVIDLGGIHTARAVEMYSQLYFALVGVLDTFDFNISIQKR